ncbi:ATP-binding protein [Cupriavidus basilensis]|uniref:ATP-binding protein n=1 Tax=Cupriavidus basilensis TaxID=68895 RepID=A0ABT6AHT1_9BURK|nr:ATP-binding protein [Cupriavidus basilensis]MDF3831958.1 ATP-binding protein [Cupriavidus basilensis]
MQIQVRINEDGALRNQRHAFTNRFTLVSELLQNARRAGAARIEIFHDAEAQRLCVHDDGRGIDDFQKLLSFHESGWDGGVVAQEHPFGVGFFKCLYAASRCIVASGGRRVDIDTAAALNKALVEVEPCAESVAGTRVELLGVDLPDLAQRIESLCSGFPVCVVFNGKVLLRRFAEANLATMPSTIGTVHLHGTRDGKATHDTMVFLQGFCVMRPTYCPDDKVNIVHLDPGQFMARLPDRDQLIDEDVQKKRIDAELKACWRRTLEIAKTRLPAERFVEIYYGALRAWGHHDLLNDLDVLPTELFDAIVGYPIQDDSVTREYVEEVAAAPTRQAIETGEISLVSLDWQNEDNAARWMLARAKGFLLFDWLGIHASHWAATRVRHLDVEPVRVEAITVQLRVEFEGRWVWPTVILCEAVRIRVGNDDVEITDAGVYHDGVLYIPPGETSGEPVRQASSFVDENEQFLQGDLDADRDALADLVRRLRCTDAVQTLDALLCELRLGKYPLLHGKTFEVTVGTGGMPGHTVTLIEGGGHAGS